MKNYRLFFFGLLIFLFLLEDGVLLYNRFHPNHTVLGLQLNNVSVSDQTKAQIAKLIKSRFDTDFPLRLSYKGKIIDIKKKDIGAVINYQQTLDELIKEGRGNNFFTNIISQNNALLGLNRKSVKGQVSKPLLFLKNLAVASEINQSPQPPRPNFAGDLSQTLPAKNGIKVKIAQLNQIILDNIFAPSPKPIEIPTEVVVKKYNTGNLEQIRKQAAEYITDPISITSAGVLFTLSYADLKSLLTVVEQVNPDNPSHNILVLGLDNTKLSQKLDPFAQKVESITNSEFNHHDSFSAIYGQFYTNTRRVMDVPIGSRRSQRVLGVSTKNGQKSIYLTFDDGPNIVYQPLLLDILKEKGVKGTFYFVGSNSKLYPSTTKRTIREGHAVADHSLTHAFLPKLLPNQIYDEMKTTKDILNSFLQPNKITLFRPPYGGINDYVRKYANDLGLAVNYWTVDPRDWSEPTTDLLVQRATDNLKDGDIILLHSNHFSTVKALPLIIDKLQQQGFQFGIQK